MCTSLHLPALTRGRHDDLVFSKPFHSSHVLNPGQSSKHGSFKYPDSLLIYAKIISLYERVYANCGL